MSWELIDSLLNQKVIIALFSIVAPIIPAYIIFKFLPARSIVKGPFKGMQVNFSGAAGLYFVVFITVFTTSNFWNSPSALGIGSDTYNYEVWEVKGKLNAESIEDYQKGFFRIMVDPEIFDISRDGDFSVDILRRRNVTTGEMEFPKLYVENLRGRFKTMTIKLDTTTHFFGEVKYDISRIDSLNKIEIKDPVSLIPSERTGAEMTLTPPVIENESEGDGVTAVPVTGN